MTDLNNNRVQKFVRRGAVAIWGGATIGDRFSMPRGIAVDGAGHVYIADTLNHRVQKFFTNGTFIAKWGRNGGDGTAGNLNGEFNTPEGIDVDAAGNVYVADTLNNRVQVFAPNGTYLRRYYELPGADSALNMPGGVGVSGAGIAFVADTFNYRIMGYRSTGAGVAQWGYEGTQTGTVPGTFYLPYGVAPAPDGTVYVADLSNRVQRFLPNGTFVQAWGSNGSADRPVLSPVRHRDGRGRERLRRRHGQRPDPGLLAVRGSHREARDDEGL